MLRILSIALVALSFISPVTYTSKAHGEESTVDKVKDGTGDATTNTKKLFRKGKRNVRKATGNDNIIKDVKDKANDVGDDVNNEADKAKRKSKSY